MTKLFLVIILFFNPFVPDVKKLITEGDEFYEKFENQKALNIFQEAYKIAPDDFEVLLKLTRSYLDVGEEYMKNGDKGKAEFYYNKAIQFSETMKLKFPEQSETWAYLAASNGDMATFKGSKDKIKYGALVEKYAKKAIELDEKDTMAYVILGLFYFELSKLNWFERTFANTFLGKIPDGGLPEAEQNFKKALRLEPEWIKPIYHLSEIYREKDMNKEEFALLKKVVSLPEKNFRDKYLKVEARERLQELQ
ncbi:MAG TPA: hypothetical protein VFF33_09160 [Ignavibacteriaceae bacterium]|nr:hypothetical protein [Ignavibacteriaceae bacterium]